MRDTASMAKAHSIVVTGAGSGIGRRTALRFMRAGWKVVLAGRTRDSLEETREQGGGAGDLALVCPTDVTDPQAVESLFREAERHCGRIGALFNNAGSFHGGGPLDEVTPNVWRATLDVNLSGAFFCAQAAFRHMKMQPRPGGHIINNGSLSAQVPRPHAVAYTATKHAITGLTKALALEGRPYGIACGQVDVGNAATAMTKGMTAGVLQPDGGIAHEPTMDAEHVADAVFYMAGLPIGVHVHQLTVLASGMPFLGRG